MLYKDVLNNWLIERKIFLKYSTYTNYYNIIHNHIMPYLGDYNIRSLNNNILQQFILQQLENGRARKSDGSWQDGIKDGTGHSYFNNCSQASNKELNTNTYKIESNTSNSSTIQPYIVVFFWRRTA